MNMFHFGLGNLSQMINQALIEFISALYYYYYFINMKILIAAHFIIIYSLFFKTSLKNFKSMEGFNGLLFAMAACISELSKLS